LRLAKARIRFLQSANVTIRVTQVAVRFAKTQSIK